MCIQIIQNNHKRNKENPQSQEDNQQGRNSESTIARLAKGLAPLGIGEQFSSDDDSPRGIIYEPERLSGLGVVKKLSYSEVMRRWIRKVDMR